MNDVSRDMIFCEMAVFGDWVIHCHHTCFAAPVNLLLGTYIRIFLYKKIYCEGVTGFVAQLHVPIWQTLSFIQVL